MFNFIIWKFETKYTPLSETIEVTFHGNLEGDLQQANKCSNRNKPTNTCIKKMCLPTK